MLTYLANKKMSNENKSMPANVLNEITVLNVLVTGSAGQLGSEIKNIEQAGKKNIDSLEAKATKDFCFYFTDKNSLDITDYSDLEKFCQSKAIQVIINCAAYTAVDKAESEQELAFDINANAVEKIAQVAKKQGISLVHISTDYVFDGTANNPYEETDLPNPLGVYGASKLAGERLMQAVNPARSMIIRTSWLYSSFGNNFLKTMLRLSGERPELNVVADQIGTPTSARSLALAILQVIPFLQNKWLQNESVKIYHYSNEGFCSWFEFAKTIFDLSAINCQVNAINSDAYPVAALRPKYTVLSKLAFQQDFKQTVIPWRQALELQLQELKAQTS